MNMLSVAESPLFLGWREAVKSGNFADKRLNALRSENAALIIIHAVEHDERIIEQIKIAASSTEAFFNSQNEANDTGKQELRAEALVQLDILEEALGGAIEIERSKSLRIFTNPFEKASLTLAHIRKGL